MYKKEYFTASIDQSFGYLTLETIANLIFFQKIAILSLIFKVFYQVQYFIVKLSLTFQNLYLKLL